MLMLLTLTVQFLFALSGMAVFVMLLLGLCINLKFTEQSVLINGYQIFSQGTSVNKKWALVSVHWHQCEKQNQIAM